jgi:uncharacterized protein YbjQ (UPF0145 family)
MIITNTDTVPGRKVREVLGIVQSNVEGARPVSGDLLKSLRHVFSNALSLGPRIVTGREFGFPAEPPPPKVCDKNAPAPDCYVDGYADLLFDLREKALKKLIKKAERIAADALVKVTFDVTVIVPLAFEVYVCGTAVTLLPQRRRNSRRKK